MTYLNARGLTEAFQKDEVAVSSVIWCGFARAERNDVPKHCLQALKANSRTANRKK